MRTKTVHLESQPENGLHIIHLFPKDAIAAGVAPSLSEHVIDDMEAAMDKVAQAADEDEQLTHLIFKSDAPVFCLGGDLATMVRCARDKNHAELTDYILKGCRYGYRIHGHLHPRVHSIAVVAGAALGGGFEVALGCETLIAEKGVKFGLPEVMFGSFAGVGAYSFLSRLVGETIAGRMMVSGKTYLSEQLCQMGVLDDLAEKGGGLEMALKLAADQRLGGSTFMAMKKVKARLNPVSFDELQDIALIWVDTVMHLPEHQLVKMETLIKAQLRRVKS